jgi:hypothetical protein
MQLRRGGAIQAFLESAASERSLSAAHRAHGTLGPCAVRGRACQRQSHSHRENIIVGFLEASPTRRALDKVLFQRVDLPPGKGTQGIPLQSLFRHVLHISYSIRSDQKMGAHCAVYQVFSVLSNSTKLKRREITQLAGNKGETERAPPSSPLRDGDLERHLQQSGGVRRDG